MLRFILDPEIHQSISAGSGRRSRRVQRDPTAWCERLTGGRASEPREAFYRAVQKALYSRSMRPLADDCRRIVRRSFDQKPVCCSNAYGIARAVMRTTTISIRELESRLVRDMRLVKAVRSGLLAWNGCKLGPRAPVARVRGKRTVAGLLVDDRQ